MISGDPRSDNSEFPTVKRFGQFLAKMEDENQFSQDTWNGKKIVCD
jgi:hypothetical protein